MNAELVEPHRLLRERAAVVHASSFGAPGSVPSPCVSVCRMDAERRFCEGCLRTIDEIRQWREAGDGARLAIWARVSQRLAVLVPHPAPVHDKGDTP